MRIPVTLIAGYLGAGKTTALNRLLCGGHGRRLAVLVNDFGAINIDAALVVAHDGQTISLANGCICCAISDDLGAALQAEVDRPDRPDHLVIEASGVADTARLARLVGGWPGLSLDLIVTMANAGAIAAQTKDRYIGALVRRQLRAADLVALSGTDLADPAAARAVISAQAPGTPVIEAPFGAIDPAMLLGPTLRDTVRAEVTSPGLPPNFHAATWTPRGPVRMDALSAALDSLPEGIHRLKGFLCDPEGQLWLVQRVGSRCTLEPSSAPGAHSSALVLIVAGPREALDTALARLDALT